MVSCWGSYLDLSVLVLCRNLLVVCYCRAPVCFFTLFVLPGVRDPSREKPSILEISHLRAPRSHKTAVVSDLSLSRLRVPTAPAQLHVRTMAVLSSAADGGTAQKVASLTWSEETIEVETCGRSYWSFLQRARAIDNKQLGNVSAFAVNEEVEEEVRWLPAFSCPLMFEGAVVLVMVWLYWATHIVSIGWRNTRGLVIFKLGNKSVYVSGPHR